MSSKLIKTDEAYRSWIWEISSRFRKSQIKAAVKVNDEMLRFYWSLGRDLAEKKSASGIGNATAGFGSESTWAWCFDGLPHNSTVAITTNGTLSDPEARRLFAGGVEALVFTLHPFAIVVCGKSPAWLDTKYPDVQIIHISSYSQIWNKRRCA